MTNREALLSLAERVEALSGSCWETDAMIAKATGWVPDCINAELWKDDEDSRPEWWFSDAFGMPAYTASIDSAMSLVPEGWTWHVDATAPELGIDWFLCEPHTGRDIKGCAGTAALALTAASLRALAQPTVPQP